MNLIFLEKGKFEGDVDRLSRTSGEYEKKGRLQREEIESLETIFGSA